MSWLEKLRDTYQVCVAAPIDGDVLLTPVAHTTQVAQIEITLDREGRFRRARILDKGTGMTVVPCTEASGGRSGKKPVPHPLCDKLQYVAGDFCNFGGHVTIGFAKEPSEPFQQFLFNLRTWARSKFTHPKVDAVLRYVERSTVVADLVAAKVLVVDSTEDELLHAWKGEKDKEPAIFRALNQGQEQDEAFVRWCVEIDGALSSGTWEDAELINAWVAFYLSGQATNGFCMVSGEEVPLAIQHPSKIRNPGDRAKLISSNDEDGLTYRGRFHDDGQAVGVGYLASQEAHSALRWLIERQGHRNADQALVSWAGSRTPVPDPFADTFEAFGDAAAADATAGQGFAIRLRNAIAGYRSRIDPTDHVMVLALDSASTGRAAIAYYREIKGSEFLDRIERWHLTGAWWQDFGKTKKFVGMPSPRDVALVVCGGAADKKLVKATVERLLPCVVDAQVIPGDLVTSAARKAIRRVGQEIWEWEKCLGIACALFKAHQPKERYSMSLEIDRRSRDYLFGRLLAVAERIEGYALYLAKEKREPTAVRLMQRFADHPASTWRTIELQLRPYVARLVNLRPGTQHYFQQLLDEVVCAFKPDDFTSERPLTPEFLLGYHCQRAALRTMGDANDQPETTNQ